MVADPEVRQTSTGKSVANVRVGISSSGNKGPKTFVNVVYWEQKADLVEKYLSKGREFLITGELATEEWEAKDGSGKRSRLYIKGEKLQFLNSGKKDSEGDSGGADDDDDIPF